MSLLIAALVAFAGIRAEAQTRGAELRCPPGTTLTGGMPPDGTERGCQRRDSRGKPIRQGPWATYFMNGMTESEGLYKDGLRTGHWVWYYPTGVKRQEGEYYGGRPTGKWAYWDEKGRVEKVEKAMGGLDALSEGMGKGFK